MCFPTCLCIAAEHYNHCVMRSGGTATLCFPTCLCIAAEHYNHCVMRSGGTAGARNKATHSGSVSAPTFLSPHPQHHLFPTGKQCDQPQKRTAVPFRKFFVKKIFYWGRRCSPAATDPSSIATGFPNPLKWEIFNRRPLYRNQYKYRAIVYYGFYISEYIPRDTATGRQVQFHLSLALRLTVCSGGNVTVLILNQ
uniref:Uncharacterized protein n=1 Tax=Oryza brachyantha TaxID=4533 RepID=J3LK97_ORYBR